MIIARQKLDNGKIVEARLDGKATFYSKCPVCGSEVDITEDILDGRDIAGLLSGSTRVYCCQPKLQSTCRIKDASVKLECDVSVDPLAKPFHRGIIYRPGRDSEFVQDFQKKRDIF